MEPWEEMPRAFSFFCLRNRPLHARGKSVLIFRKNTTIMKNNESHEWLGDDE